MTSYNIVQCYYPLCKGTCNISDRNSRCVMSCGYFCSEHSQKCGGCHGYFCCLCFKKHTCVTGWKRIRTFPLLWESRKF